MKITRPKFLRTSEALCRVLQSQLAGRRFVVLTDETVSENCMMQLSDFLNRCEPLDIIEVEPGEQCKTPEVCLHLWTHLLELGISKSDVIVCLGGGSICDLGGFIGATFKRGVSCIFIPTTLLAMTDAAIGGKNGIDLDSVKNAIGTIVQPEAIFIYPEFCVSLSQRHFKSGLAEIIKHGAIAGGTLWENLTELSLDSQKIDIDLLRKSVQVKWDIVRRDVADQHIRKVLNFGHTIGHAVESAMLNEGVGLEHGYAVAFGMLVEGHYASLTGNLDPNLFQTFRGLIIKWYSQDYPTLPSWESILSYLKQDKKSDSEKISWFIPAFSSQFEKFTIKNFAELEVPYNQSVIDLIASRY